MVVVVISYHVRSGAKMVAATTTKPRTTSARSQSSSKRSLADNHDTTVAKRAKTARGRTSPDLGTPHPLRRRLNVPPPSLKSERATYESVEEPNRRIAWFHHVVGDDGVYLGRPKNDGGWFRVPDVKRGSFLANPFPIPPYAREESLRRYKEFLEARLCEGTTTKALIEMLPPPVAALASEYYLPSSSRRGSKDDGKAQRKSGKSTAYLELDIPCGEPFERRLLALRGRRASCFCPLDEPCHVDVVLKKIDELNGRRGMGMSSSSSSSST